MTGQAQPAGQVIKKRDLNRSWIVRIGKKLRKRINPIIRKYSKVGDQPVLNNQHFPWIADLKAKADVINAEVTSVMRYREAIPYLSEISPDHAKLDAKKKWRSYFLYGYGFRSNDNCARCPETTKILQAIPGLRTALFSIHEPGMTIAPHKGVTAGICVVHMGIKIPKDYQSCAIQVANEIIHWREGEVFVFDDTYKHETWNLTDQERIILLLHVDRPVRFPGSWLAWIFMQGIRWSPFIGDARKKMARWNKAYEKLERK